MRVYVKTKPISLFMRYNYESYAKFCEAADISLNSLYRLYCCHRGNIFDIIKISRLMKVDVFDLIIFR